MAKGDVVNCAPTQVANNGSLTIQPGAGVEWLIKNIYYGGAVEFYKTDGANPIKFDSDASAGGRICVSYLLTNAQYMTVKNVSGGNIYICFDGMATK